MVMSELKKDFAMVAPIRNICFDVFSAACTQFARSKCTVSQFTAKISAFRNHSLQSLVGYLVMSRLPAP
jgi:hypothetical protein